MNKIFYNGLCGVLAPFFKLIYKVETKHIEKIPKSEALIICANHTSNVDPILLATTVRRNIRYMTKAELFKNKILGKFLYALGAFPIIRGKGDKAAIESSLKVIENKEILGIFIEGTRSKTGKLLRPKSGASLISLKTNTPILPVCISCNKLSGAVKMFNDTKIFFGDLVYPKDVVKNFCAGGFERSDLRLMNQAIMNQIANMKKKIIEEK